MTVTSDILTADTLADLKDMPVAPGVKVFLFGKMSVGDSLGGFFYWDANAAGPEDAAYMNVVPSNKSAAGRWRRNFTRSLVYPQGLLVNSNGVKKFYADGVTNSQGECTLYLTEDNTATGPALFASIKGNTSRANTTAAGPADAVNSYTKSQSSDLKMTRHGFYKPNPVTITLGLLYSPFAAAPAGVPVQFEITGT